MGKNFSGAADDSDSDSGVAAKATAKAAALAVPTAKGDEPAEPVQGEQVQLAEK